MAGLLDVFKKVGKISMEVAPFAAVAPGIGTVLGIADVASTIAENLFGGRQRGPEKLEFVVDILMKVAKELQNSKDVAFGIQDWELFDAALREYVSATVKLRNATSWF
jgi:ABC-type amino acid transport substrate-binding protein